MMMVVMMLLMMPVQEIECNVTGIEQQPVVGPGEVPGEAQGEYAPLVEVVDLRVPGEIPSLPARLVGSRSPEPLPQLSQRSSQPCRSR